MIYSFATAILFLFFFFFPFWGAPLVFFFSIFDKRLMSYSIVFVSISFALLEYAIAFHGYDPDVVRYYSTYENDFLSALEEMKFYRFFVFYFMDKLSLSACFYSFFSIFLMFFLYFKGALNILKAHGVELVLLKHRILFFMLGLTLLPFSMYFTFENLMAFIVFFYGMSLSVLYNKVNFKVLVFILFSFLIHFSVILLCLLFFVARFSIRSRACNIISYVLFFGTLILLVTLMNVEVSIGVGYVDTIFNKAYRYSHNVWANLTPKELVNYLPYIFMKLFLTFFTSWSFLKKDVPIDKVYYRFLSFLAILLISFITNRMIVIRFGWFYSIFILPLIIMYLHKFYAPLFNKVVIIGMCLMIWLSIPNLFFVKKVGNAITIGDDYVFFYNIANLASKRTDIPSVRKLKKLTSEVMSGRENDL